jgi:hypothetical protein
LLAPLLFVLPLLLSDSIADPGRPIKASSTRVRVLDASQLRQKAKSGPAKSRVEVKLKNQPHSRGAQQKAASPGKIVEVRKVESTTKTAEGGTR